MGKRKAILPVFEVHDDLYLKKVVSQSQEDNFHNCQNDLALNMSITFCHSSLYIKREKNVLGNICTKQLRTRQHLLNTEQKLSHQVRKHILLWGFLFFSFLYLFIHCPDEKGNIIYFSTRNSKRNEVLALLNCVIL